MFDQIYNFLVNQMHTNQFFTGAALGGVFLSTLYSLKAIPFYIWSRIERKLTFSATIEQVEDMFDYMDEYMEANHKKTFQRVEISSEDDKLCYTHENDFIFTWYKNRRIRISKSKESIETPGDRHDLFKRTYRVSGLFAKRAITSLLHKINEEGLENKRRRSIEKKEIKIYTVSQYGSWNVGKSTATNKSIDDIYLENKQLIVDDVDRFIASESLYRKLRIPHKRGYLFYGVPGTGKSALSWAIADKLKYDLYLLDLSGVSSVSDFKTLVNRIPSRSVIVVEDIDSYFDKREAVKDNKITFSSFINVLSGVNQIDDSVTIITTNKIEKIDEALLRSGRCDVKLEIKPITVNEAQQFLQDKIDPSIVLSSFKEMPFVELQEIALKHHNDPNKIIKLIGNE